MERTFLSLPLANSATWGTQYLDSEDHDKQVIQTYWASIKTPDNWIHIAKKGDETGIHIPQQLNMTWGLTIYPSNSCSDLLNIMLVSLTEIKYYEIEYAD